MSKKDYIKFAAMFKDAGQYVPENNHAEAMRKHIMFETAKLFHYDNSAFRPYQFFEACGLDKETAYNFEARI